MARHRHATARPARPLAGAMAGPWHPDHPRCRSCGTTVVPHLSDGYCRRCYRETRGLGERGHEAIPTRRPGDPPEGGPRA